MMMEPEEELTFPYVTLNHLYQTKPESGFGIPDDENKDSCWSDDACHRSWDRLLQNVNPGQEADVAQPVPHLSPERCTKIQVALRQSSEEMVCKFLGKGNFGDAFLCIEGESKFVIKKPKHDHTSVKSMTNEMVGAMLTKHVPHGVVKAMGWCSQAASHVPWNEDEFIRNQNEAMSFGADEGISFGHAFGGDYDKHIHKFPQNEKDSSNDDDDNDDKALLVLSYAGHSLSDFAKNIDLLGLSPSELASRIVRILHDLGTGGVQYTDLKPGNVCVKTELDEAVVTIIDLGGFVPEGYYSVANEHGRGVFRGKKRTDFTAKYNDMNGVHGDSNHMTPTLRTLRALAITIANVYGYHRDEESGSRHSGIRSSSNRNAESVVEWRETWDYQRLKDIYHPPPGGGGGSGSSSSNHLPQVADAPDSLVTFEQVLMQLDEVSSSSSSSSSSRRRRRGELQGVLDCLWHAESLLRFDSVLRTSSKRQKDHWA